MSDRFDAVHVLTQEDLDYPVLLKEIPDPPRRLYVKGNIAALSTPSIAIVGSRVASEYGRKVCKTIASGLAGLGVTVVSGLARGIDAAGHQSSLNAGGRTIAVLGHGLGQIYPPENTALAHDIISSGGALVTEFEHSVGIESEHFPRRNRIISGLSLGAVVVEARKRSGSLITARLALEQGREVFAVPGPVNLPNSQGVHRLIQDGAKLVHDLEDILDEIPSLKNRVMTQSFSRDRIRLEGPEARIHALLGEEPKHMDELITASTLSAHEVMGGLMKLSVKRLARELPGKRFVKV